MVWLFKILIGNLIEVQIDVFTGDSERSICLMIIILQKRGYHNSISIVT
jgi:hypothetical protein